MPDGLFILVDSTIFFSVCGNDLNEVEILVHNIFNNMTKFTMKHWTLNGIISFQERL